MPPTVPPSIAPIKRLGAENPTCIAGSVTGRDREELQDQQKGHDAEGHSSVQCVSHEAIADSQNLWDKQGYHTNNDAARSGLEPNYFLRQSHEPFACSQEKLRERHGNQAASNSYQGIYSEFQRISELILRDLEQRVIA